MTAWFSTCPALFACVHVPEFPAQALLRMRPQLRALPVAVLEGEPPQERVCAGNADARRYGLARGMTRAEAESFAGIAILRRSPPEEETARAVLLSCAGRFTPLVETCHSDTAAICVLDVHGMTRLHPDAQAFAETLRQVLLAAGLRGSIAISANYYTARALAEGRAGITIVRPGEEQKELAPLLLQGLEQCLGPSEEQLQTLAMWGIRTLGGLAALPQKQLIARMGDAGKQLRALARGERPHLFAPVALPLQLKETFSFEAPVRLLEGILFVLSPMLDQLLLRAREHALALAAVTITLTLASRALDTEEDGRAEAVDRRLVEPEAAGLAMHSPAENRSASPSPANKLASLMKGAKGMKVASSPSDTARSQADAWPVQMVEACSATTYRRTVRPTVPTVEKRLLLKLLQLDLAAHPPPSSVLAIELEAEAATTGAVQSGLFAPPLPEPSRLDVTLARLSALVGEGRVGSPALRDTHTPDSFSMGRFRNELAALEMQSAGTAPALRLLRPAEPTTVQSEAGQPARFRWKGELYRVRTACGPWRQNGAWWSSERWSYESWDVAAERIAAAPAADNRVQGVRAVPPGATLCCRLQRNLEQDQWCVEGMYD